MRLLERNASASRRHHIRKPLKYLKVLMRAPPRHCLVPGTDFTVDWHCRTEPKYVHSFLSHAHEDHLAGIRSFKLPRRLHCTPVTAKMLVQKVPQIRPCLVLHEPGSAFELCGTRIQVLDAGHTAGSAMFLFTLSDGCRVLHTGDFRAEPCVVDGARKFAPVDHLFMDCTFALEKVEIPAREVCSRFVIDVAREKIAQGFTVLLGTYTIGKEALIRQVAQALGQRVWAPEPRMQGLEFMFGRDGFLCNDESAALVHVVSMEATSYTGVVAYATAHGLKRVVAMQLTGWAAKKGWDRPRVRREGDFEAVLYGVPYSDHSSREELRLFVEAMQPAKLTPTTHTDEKQVGEIMKMFLHHMRRAKNRTFIDFYCKATK